MGGRAQTETGTAHAEVLAVWWLLAHRRNFKKHTKIEIVLYRERKNGSIGMAKPCIHCTRLLKKAVFEYSIPIKWIYWSTDNGTFDVSSVADLETTHMSSGTKRILYTIKGVEPPNGGYNSDSGSSVSSSGSCGVGGKKKTRKKKNFKHKR